MNTREYLIAKGHSPEAIVCNDWNLLNSDFDLEEMLEDYHQAKLKNLSQHIVRKCGHCKSEDTIDYVYCQDCLEFTPKQ